MPPIPSKRAFYSLVQYVPDGSRAESANAGVVLFVPSSRRIEIRTSPTLARVRKFFAPEESELQRIALSLEALKNRMALARDEFIEETDFAHFVAARADEVRLTPPRLVMVADPLIELNELYEELVGDPDQLRQRAARVAPLPPRVAEVFGRLVAEHKAWQPRSITVPTVRRKFAVSMAYQNGIINYVRSESLASKARPESRLPQLGFNGRLIHEHPIDGERGQLIVLSSDAGAEPDMEEEFERVLRDFQVRFVPHRRTEAFAAEVEKAAH